LAETKDEKKKADAPAPAAAPSTPAQDEKKKYSLRQITAVAMALVVLIVGGYFGLDLMGWLPKSGPDYHAHADFKVYIMGKPFNFSQDKYMTKEACGPESGAHAHLHDGNGEVAHVHEEGITWGDFFWSLGMKLNVTCFILDTEETYCDDRKNTLKFYVNGKKNFEFEKKEIWDLDRVLISYGPETPEEILWQFGTVSNNACAYSEKCLERKIPISPDHDCT